MAARKRQASGSSSGKTKKKKNSNEDELSIAWAAVHSAMAAQLPALLLEKAHEIEVKAEQLNFCILWDSPCVDSEEQKLYLVKLAESIHDVKFGEWGSIHLNSMFTANYVYSCKFLGEEGKKAIEIKFNFQLTHDGGCICISHQGKDWCNWSSYEEGLNMNRKLKKKDLKVQDQLLGSGQEKITLGQLIGLMCNLDVMKDVRLARPTAGAGPHSL